MFEYLNCIVLHYRLAVQQLQEELSIVSARAEAQANLAKAMGEQVGQLLSSFPGQLTDMHGQAGGAASEGSRRRSCMGVDGEEGLYW